jgi:hypothetical protein
MLVTHHQYKTGKTIVIIHHPGGGHAVTEGKSITIPVEDEVTNK